MKQYILILLVLQSFLGSIYAQNTPATIIDVGVKNSPFTYIHTQNTAQAAHYFGNSTYDVWYKFTIERSMEVILSHCGSELPHTFLHLLNASKGMMTSLSNTNQRGGRCPDTDHPYFKETLPAGTYYVVSEGCYADGNITTSIIANSIESGIPIMDLGSKNGPFVFENIQNTIDSKNYHSAQRTNDVWYKFTLEKTMDIIISHCGSQLPSTFLHLLNASKGTIASITNANPTGGRCPDTSHPYFRNRLQAGTYYVVCEGNGADGMITTRISGSIDGIPTTDLGITNAPFTSVHTQNTTYSAHYFGSSTYDAWYRFTLASPSEVILSHCGSELPNTILHLLNASKSLMISLSNANQRGGRCDDTKHPYFKEVLPAGTYYVVSEGDGKNGNITTNITVNVYIPPMNLGTKDLPFTYSNTQNTANFTNGYTGQTTNDFWYKFTLTKPMEVTVSHCGSALSDTYLHLLDASKTLIASNDDYYDAGMCSNVKQAYLKRLLPAGTYYVVSEGKTENGNITTNITADAPVTDLGSRYRAFDDTDTQNTANSANYYTGQATNDIWYKFTLIKPVEVAISHCGSALSDTYLYLLDASKTLIASNDDYTGAGQCADTKHAYLKKQLEPGLYYVVSEGKTENGNITTKITGNSALGTFPIIDIGTKSESFTNVDLKNGINFANNYAGRTSPDIWYKFTLTKSMQTIITYCSAKDNNFSLDPKPEDPYLFLLDSTRTLIAFNGSETTVTDRGCVLRYLMRTLFPDTYYVVSEGDKEIFTSVSGMLQSVTDLGSWSDSFAHSHTKSTANSSNYYEGQNTNDVKYKFTLTKAMEITIDYWGSELSDICMYLLDASENWIASADLNNGWHPQGNENKYPPPRPNLQWNFKKALPPGTYYIVAEGYNTNGNLVINISGNTQPFINVGTKSENFTYEDTQDTNNSANFHTLRTPNDVRYRFTLTRGMEITLSHCGSELLDTYIHLLDSTGKQISYNDDYSGVGKCLNSNHAYLKKSLPVGTYDVISEGYNQNGNITTTITGNTFIGALPSTDLGTISGPFKNTYTQNTANTANYYVGQNTNDVMYKFTLDKPFETVVSNCGSEVADTYLYLFNASGEMIVSNDDYSGEGHCSNTKQAYLKQLLPAGTYYLVSEGKTGNGNITTNITVDIPMTNLGSKSAPFDYSNTQNTDNSANYYTGQPAKDVWYKFTLEKTLEVIISHCESGLSDTYLSLLDASRKLIVSNDDYDGDGHCFNIRQAYLKRLLAAGTYYVVSEGKTGNGNITTTISADIPITDLGSKNAPFDYSLAQNTINTANYYAGQPTNDAWYKFTLEIPMEIVISLCESRISDTYLSLLDASRNLITFNDDYDGDGRCFYTKQAYLKQLLSAGTYYVVLEGKTENGIIAPRITASVPIVDLGAKSRSFSETLTGNTDVLADYYSGQSTKDIWYRFELNMEMHITVSNCGSALPDTYLYLLDKSKNLIVSNDDYVGSGQCTNTKHAYLQRLLESGVYYIVSEGKGQNGGIVTIISGITASVGSTASQPSDGQNYIRTRTYLSENGNLFMDAVQYYDGLGRPSQQVHTGITPGRKDLIARREYDAFGRESKAWLPVPVAGNKGAYYTGTFSTDVYGNDTYSYSEPVYEPSPLNRIEKQYGPGQAWRDGNGHFVKTDYLTNNSSYPCAYYYVSGDNLVKNSNYTDNNLYVTEITDEDGNESYEFKDKLDRVVLQRQMEGTDRYDTYYVYDDFGNLRFVLPPLAADSATTNKSYSVSTSYIKNYAYIYKYDHRNRCTEKKLPGCEPVNYTYDNADRLIFYQDGELKDKSQWHFSIPDVFGRVVLEGICTGPSWNDAVKAEYSNNASGTFSAYGYTVSNINLTLVQLLRVNYYDNYKFKTKQAFANNTHYDYTSTLTGFENKRYGADGDEVKSKGLLTGSITVLLDNSGDRLYSVFYYDSRGRMIQSVASNHLNGYEKEYVNYSFTGQPTRKQTLHSAQGKSNITEIYSYYYDHADRPVITEYQIDNGETITLSELTYDDLDRVKTKGVHGSKEKITYNYNIRNWVKKIDSGRFKEILYYTEGNAPLFNGNISQVEWGFGLKDNVWIQDDYLFSYDGLNRLTKSTYGVSTSNPLNNYTEEAAYDKMGNITALKRSGHIELGTFDKLSLTYNGNRLSSVTEAGKPGEGFIKPPGNPAREYAYNKNGALTEDFNGGISQIQYNWLNLPERIQFAYGHSTQYKYDATGMKHRVTHTSVKSNLNVPAGKTTIPATQQISYVLTTDYVSNLVYENESLKYILNPEGYAVRTMNGGYAYNYYQKDHLGNNRVVLEINRVNSLVNQTTDYYPFGMPYLNNSFPERQPYKFGGKELDEMHGLNWYDFHARQLSTAIPRFTTVDPLAEKYYSVSPYVYCNNNPVRFMDSDGREFIDSNGKRVTIMYNRDGSLSFSKNATTDIVRAANALNLTDAGRSQLVKMDQSDIKVKLNISSDTKITQRADGKTSYVYGEAIQGNYNEKDNYGRKVNHDGTYGIKDASITIYEGTIKEGIRNGSGLKHEGLSLEQAIGAVVGHEGVHATDKVEINKDLKAEMQGKTHVDREVKPNQIEQIIINQYKK